MNIGVFAKIYDKIKGRPLLQDLYLINTISELVPRELATAWLEKLKKSIKTAHLLDESRPDGKVYALDKPQLIQAAKPSDEVLAVKDEKLKQAEEPSENPGVVRTPIPLGVGRLAHIELPRDWDKRG